MKRSGLASVALFGMASLANADVMQCPELDTCCQATNVASRTTTWPSFRDAIASARGCDDGWIAEAYSDQVSLMLSEHWAEVGELGRVCTSDPWLCEFVLKHLDETVPADRLLRIRDLAHTECPKEQRKLCKQIRKRTG